MQSNSTVTLKQDCIPDTVCDNFGKGADSGPSLPAWQAWYKPLGPNSAAIFVVNHAATPVPITINFADVPGLGVSSTVAAKYVVTDVWKQESLDGRQSSYTDASLGSHDSVFIMIHP